MNDLMAWFLIIFLVSSCNFYFYFQIVSYNYNEYICCKISIVHHKSKEDQISVNKNYNRKERYKITFNLQNFGTFVPKLYMLPKVEPTIVLNVTKLSY
jgi:hypothetical protein